MILRKIWIIQGAGIVKYKFRASATLESKTLPCPCFSIIHLIRLLLFNYKLMFSFQFFNRNYVFVYVFVN